MLKISLTGYVNSVRTNTLPSGKTVTNVRLGVTIDKEAKKYQSFDIAFWEQASTQASLLQEKDYVSIPDVLIRDIKTSDDGKWVQISGSAYLIFKSLPLNNSGSNSNYSKKTKEVDTVPHELFNEDSTETTTNIDSVPF
jgi:hypothetical protein